MNFGDSQSISLAAIAIRYASTLSFSRRAVNDYGLSALRGVAIMYDNRVLQLRKI